MELDADEGLYCESNSSKNCSSFKASKITLVSFYLENLVKSLLWLNTTIVRKSSNLNICLDKQKFEANDKQDMTARAPTTRIFFASLEMS